MSQQPVKLEYEIRDEDKHHRDVILTIWFSEEDGYYLHCLWYRALEGSGNLLFSGIALTEENIALIQLYPKLFEAFAQWQDDVQELDNAQKYPLFLQWLDTQGFTLEKGTRPMATNLRQQAMNFCREQAGNLVGSHTQAADTQRSSWTQLGAKIRDDGLEAATQQCQDYLKKARANTNPNVDFDTTVENTFLSWLGV